MEPVLSFSSLVSSVLWKPVIWLYCNSTDWLPQDWKSGFGESWSRLESILYFWTPGSSRKGPIKYGLSVLPCFHPSSICPSVQAFSWNCIVSFFWNLAWCQKLIWSCAWQTWIFWEKIFFASKLGKRAQNGLKTRFFQFIGKFGHQFLLNLIYNGNFYYLLCSCTNPIFGTIFVPEIWAKMFSANQIAGYFNQPYLQNKSMK